MTVAHEVQLSTHLGQCAGGLCWLILYSQWQRSSSLPDITASPTAVSQVIKPGNSYSGSFQVIDQGKTAYNFEIYAAPYHVSGENYTPDFTVLPSTPNVTSWFKFSLGSSHINAGQSVLANFTITMPAGTQPGAYFAVVFAQTQFPTVPNSITLNERVGVIFYLQAAGQVTNKGQLLTWQSSIFQEPPLTSAVRIEDSGALNFPAFQVNVKDIFGQTKYSLNTIKQILPQTIRRVTIPWSETPAFGLFKVNGSVNFLNHTHQLSTKWVLVMSRTVRLILLAILLVIVLLALVIFIRSHRRQHHFKKQP